MHSFQINFERNQTMKSSKMRLISLVLTAILAIAPLASCSKKTPADLDTDTPTKESSTSQSDTDKETEGSDESEKATSKDTEGKTESDTENQPEKDTSDKNESDTEKDTDASEPDTDALLKGDYATTIENAYYLANTVNSYYTDATRSAFVMENGNVSVIYDMATDGHKQVAGIYTKSGKAYLEDTMDVFLKMSDGGTYYASSSNDDGIANIYRLGYYYYENRIDGQSFVGERKITDSKLLKHILIKRYNMTEELSRDGGILKVRVTDNTDPWFSFDRISFSAEKYNTISLTMKANNQFSGLCSVYINAGEYANSGSFRNEQSASFTIIPDGEYHTYLIPLENIPGYTGDVTDIRFDIDTFRGAIDATLEIKELAAVQVESTSAPLYPRVCRIFGAYSDKLHHTVQISTYQDLEGVDSVGTVTNISAEKVSKILIKDKNGYHTSLDGVDFASAEYVAFDIIDVGVIGFILPYDGKGGNIEITLDGGVYSVVQTMAVKDGKLYAPKSGEKNANDFYMGFRIYTDENHSFDAFLKAAEEERHPLTNKNIIVNKDKSTSGEFLGYDSLRGIYHLTIDGDYGFNPPFLLYNNRQYNVTFTLRGEDTDRSFYIMARLEEGGSLECAALLDNQQMLIPVPLEVGKNFTDGGGGIHDTDDARFSETILPITLHAGKKVEYSIVNMYHKWGSHLLKQISFITYFAPYYHLSTGIHESNCLIPYYYTKNGNALNMLPDHRPMSAPLWDTDPQHTYCGNHEFLQYTDSEGNYSASENTRDVIGSYGPMYADITMDFISDDGRIKVSYNHMEMPQTDENRAYYEMTYEILEDISFKDFANDFSFYNATGNDPAGFYTKVGYLGEDNKYYYTDAVTGRDESKQIVLGDNCPYFSFFDMDGCVDSRGYSNLSFLISDYEFVIGGAKADTNFVVINEYGRVSLSLNLKEVTLKAGDSFKINAIIMPWGSQLLDDGIVDEKKGNYEYTSVINEATGELYMDKNVRDVRENTILDPAVATAVENATVLDTAFLPSIKTTDGKSASFKLSGGENYISFRVYGFDMLTVPVLEELVDGDWVVVNVASIHTPDAMGYGYQYDGYMVHYDGDGTFSYSFVTDMTGDSERTFRVTAAAEFEGWEEITNADDEPFIFDAVELEGRANQNPRFTSTELLEENGRKFMRFAGSSSEAYLALFADNEETSGKYLAIKYRIPATNPDNLVSWNFFTSTVSNSATSADSYWAGASIVANGEWQVIIFDIDAYGIAGFDANANGDFVAKYLRVDIFNGATAPETVCDIEYIAMFDSLESALEKNSDIEAIMLSTGPSAHNYISSDPSVDLNNRFLFDAADINAAANMNPNFISHEILTENEKSFVRFKGSKSEAYLTMLSGNTSVTGDYLVLKYRVPSDNEKKMVSWNFFTSTVNDTASGADSHWAQNMLISDGEWQVLVIDMSMRNSDSFIANGDGTYTAKYLRLDIFNEAVTENTVVDLEYIAFYDNLDKIFELNSDMEQIMLSKSASEYEYISKDSSVTLNFMANASQIYAKTSPIVGKLGSVTIAEDQSYVRFQGSTSEVTTLLLSGNKNPTGQYIVLKYRMPSTNTDNIAYWNFFTSTVNDGAVAEDAIYGDNMVLADDAWHVLVIDVANQTSVKDPNTFVSDDNGVYTAKYLRFDIFNGDVADDTYYDVSYIGLCDSLDTVLEYCKDEGEIIFGESRNEYKVISTETGEEIPAESNAD